MVLDLLRFGYKSTWRMWQDDPAGTRGYWFRAAKGAKVYLPESYFRSALWDGEFDCNIPVGEDRIAVEWRGQTNPAGYLGTNHCGSDAAMSFGGIHGIDPPIATGPDGRAACCAELNQLALVAGGEAASVRQIWRPNAASSGRAATAQQLPPLQYGPVTMGCSVPARQDWDVPYVGEYRWMLDSTPPAGWLLCDGSTIGSSTYPALTALLGDTFGAHSGTSYYLPDPRGRSLLDAGSGSGLTPRSPGDSGGEETHLLSANESGLPAHAHPQQGLNAGGATLSVSADFVRQPASPFAALVNTLPNSAANALLPHQNMHPWICPGYLMIYAGV